MKLKELEKRVQEDILNAINKFSSFCFTEEETYFLLEDPRRRSTNKSQRNLEIKNISNGVLSRPLGVNPILLAGPATDRPWIYINPKGKVTSPQLGIFGVYAFRVIVRRWLMGLHYFIGGEILRLSFVAPSSSMALLYATASEHLLVISLALWGKVILEAKRYDFLIPWACHGQIKENQSILADFNGNNWALRLLQRSHHAYWSLLQEIDLNEAPTHIQDFLHYAYSSGQEPIDWQNFEQVRNALEAAAQLRHDMLYGCYSFDDFAFNETINSDERTSATGVGLDARCKAQRDFALQSLGYIADRAIETLKNATLCVDIARELYLSWRDPPFEWPFYPAEDIIKNYLKFENAELVVTLLQILRDIKL
jgi:hypothetical protein